MFRFNLVIGTHLFKVIKFRRMMIKALKDDSLTRQQRYDIGQQVVYTISKKSQAIVESSGIENLPKEDGYLICANHQGRFDAVAILQTHSRPLSMVIDSKRSDVSVQKYYTDLTESVRINRENPREGIKALYQVRDGLNSGQNFCIFPEGKYGDNHNNLQTFEPGTFHTIKMTNAPIVPVCCYDTYKIYHVTLLKKTKCSVHYLKPIYPSEYKDLSKQEIADLVKSRIQAKIDELNKQASLEKN